MANQITVFLDPTQIPNRQVQDQQVFDGLVAAMFANLPVFGAQLNAAAASINASLNGVGFGTPYTIDLSSTTDADPGNGKLRFNSATQSASTVLRLDLLSSNTADYTAVLDTFDASTSAIKGRIALVKQGDAKTFLVFDVTARTAPSGYRNISVTPVASSSANPFVAGDAVLLFFQRTGDKGDTGSVPSFPNLYVRYEVASGTAPDTITTSWGTRALNTVKTNNITGASLASNQITLPAGTYEYVITAPGYNGGHKARLQNITDGTTADVGTSEMSATSAPGVTRSVIRGQLTIAAQKVFAVQHYNALSSNPGGIATGISGVNEVYTEAQFKKVS